jgi:DNA-binding transcriptional MocR family regulator
MKIELNDVEREYLLSQLRDHYGTLRGQVHHVTITKFSEQLKGQINLIKGLIDKLEGSQTEKERIEQARQYGVRLYPTSHYWLRPPKNTKPTLLMDYGGVPIDHIPDAVERLAQAWQEK